MSEHELNVQHKRQTYLNKLGITSWLPRTQLDGAKSSQPWVFDYLWDKQTESVNNIDESAAELASYAELESPKITAPQTALVEAVEQKTVEKKTSTAEVAKAAVVSETRQTLPKVDIGAVNHSRRKAPKFLLRFWAFDQILLVDSQPTKGQGRISDVAYRNLAINLVRAMGSKAEQQKDIAALGWPMLAGVSLDQGLDQAYEAVEYKLSKALQDDYQPKLILLLGEAAVQMVMKRDEPLDALKGLPFSFSSTTRALATFSLTQMLQIPDCKRDVWQDVQKVLPITGSIS